MSGPFARRSFLRLTAQTSALAALSDLQFLLPPVGAEETKLPAPTVQFGPEIEPLVRLLEETPRDRLLEEMGTRLKAGLSYRELLAALLLAGVRNIQPRPVGFKFHAVLVVNSARLASLASPEGDRWLPLFWALDQFKSSQAADVREGDWTLGAPQENALPAAHRARRALEQGLDDWDEPAVDAAITVMARQASAHEIFETLCPYGVRDFREIGHKAIYIANSFRTLEGIGWQHAEPVLRSLAYALLDRAPDKVNPAQADLPADRPYRRNQPLAGKIRADWLDGKRSRAATTEMLSGLRAGSAIQASELTVTLLNRGVHPNSIFDAVFIAAGEMLMHSPGIRSLHALTFTNAVHYAFQHVASDATRRLLLLQNAAFIPLFRGTREPGSLRLDELSALPVSAEPARAINEIFENLSADRLAASRRVLGYLQKFGDAARFADEARRLIFLKGRDSHDYKFSSAVLEDYAFLPSPWREQFLAASVYNLRGAGETNNALVARIRAALG